MFNVYRVKLFCRVRGIFIAFNSKGASVLPMILTLAALSLTSTANAQYGGGVFHQIDQCAYECSQRCESMLSDLEQRIQNARGACNAHQPVDQGLFQDAYTWAYSSSGLNLTTAAAREFAQQIVDMPNGRHVLSAFRAAYNWAYSSSGLNLTTTAARAWAWRIVRQRNPGQAMACYKQAYQFAYSPSGMNLTSSAAREHAERTCRIQ